MEPDFLKEQYSIRPPMVGSDTSGDVGSQAQTAGVGQADDNKKPAQSVMPVFDSRPFNAKDVYFEYLDQINYQVPAGYNMILRKVCGNSYSDAAATVPAIIPTGLKLNINVNGINRILDDPNYGLSSVFDADIFTTIPEGSALSGSVVAQSQLLNGIFSSWVQGSFISAKQWGNIAFGNGLFVAINGTDANVAISSDGINWVQVPSGMPGAAQDIAFGNGIFMMLSSGGAFGATSPDGINWTQIAPPVGATAHVGICYGNGLWVRIVNGGGFMQSSTSANNGLTWTALGAAFGVGSTIRSPIFANGLFVASDASSGTGVIVTSPDGLNWTQRAAFAGITIGAIVWNGSIFAGLGGGAPSNAVYSADGINWTKVVLGNGAVSAGGGAADGRRVVAFGNGVFKGAAGSVGLSVSSADGKVWTTEQTPVANTTIAYGKGIFTEIQAVIGGGGNAYYVSQTPAQIIAGGLKMKYAITGQLIPSGGKSDNQAVFG